MIGITDGAARLTVTDVDEPAAVAMSGSRAYVSSVSAAHDEILAFDTDSERIVATYPVEFGITDLVVSPNGRYVYTGRTGADGAGVAILDTSTGKQGYVPHRRQHRWLRAGESGRPTALRRRQRRSPPPSW